MSIPSLRADYIPQGWKEITDMADSLNDPKIDKFVKYFRRFWLPLAEIISVWDVAVKTNNICENYNMLLNKRFRRHPEFFKMIGNSFNTYFLKIML